MEGRERKTESHTLTYQCPAELLATLFELFPPRVRRVQLLLQVLEHSLLLSNLRRRLLIEIRPPHRLVQLRQLRVQLLNLPRQQFPLTFLTERKLPFSGLAFGRRVPPFRLSNSRPVLRFTLNRLRPLPNPIVI